MFIINYTGWKRNLGGWVRKQERIRAGVSTKPSKCSMTSFARCLTSCSPPPKFATKTFLFSSRAGAAQDASSDGMLCTFWIFLLF